MFPREKQQDTEWRYDRLQRLMESVWRSMFSEPCPRTVLFSFRDYGLTTQSSYWYYALKIHEHLSAYGKVFRIKFRQHLCECELTAWWERNDELKLNTLKWTRLYYPRKHLQFPYAMGANCAKQSKNTRE